jgi:hypothetical protein
MSYFDLIRELRSGETDAAKAAKAMKVLGWISIGVGIWNYVFLVFLLFKEMPISIDPEYPVVALVCGMFLGGLFFLSGRGIAGRELWGRRLGQLTVALFAAAIVGGSIMMFTRINVPVMPPVPFMAVFLIIFLAQFVIPAFYGIRYLGRLPVDENGYERPMSRAEQPTRLSETGIDRKQSTSGYRYKEAPVPFGILGTFFLLIAVPMIIAFAAQRFAGPALSTTLFLAMFLLIFAGPVLYNQVPSGFERARIVAASYTGGGSLFLFNGSWPFFRLLVYDDGVEIRIIFHRFFIPYDKMDDLPEKVGFFSSGVLFKSDLPDVPSSIRFYGFGSKRILEFLKEKRNRYLARNSASVPSQTI